MANAGSPSDPGFTPDTDIFLESRKPPSQQWALKITGYELASTFKDLV